MLKNKKAVLFDLDGTVTDSMNVWPSIDKEYLESHGVKMTPEIRETIQKDIEGASMTLIAKYFKTKFGIKDEVDKIINDWNQMAFDKYCNQVTLKPNADVFIKYLKDNNFKIGICTSNSRILAEAILKKYGLFELFDVILCGCGDIPGKPAPDIYLKAAADLSVEPSTCIVFEDLVVGIKAGKAAGMVVCAVRDSYSEYQLEEKKALADYFIEDYNECF